MATLLSYVTGRAAKAGIGALLGIVGSTATVGTLEATGNAEIPLLGYVVIGIANGFATWLAVYNKRNHGY